LPNGWPLLTQHRNCLYAINLYWLKLRYNCIKIISMCFSFNHLYI
jgi:hypothetical protein